MRDHKTLEAWRCSHSVVQDVLGFCQMHWRPHAKALFDQLQRAALSIQLNIAEGYALWTPARFRNHLQIAYGSAVETSELLEILQSRDLIPSENLNLTLDKCRRCQRLLLGLIKKYQAS